MKADVLIIEDVRELAELVSMYLEREGMNTVLCESAEEALKTIENRKFDLVILDLNLPGMDGFEFLTIFRRENATPVMIMSARDSDEDIIAGLGSGGDEFVTKPFSPRVFAARARAMLRREQNAGISAEKTVKFGDYTLFETTCILKKGDERVYLSAKEYEVLDYLARHPGAPVKPETIYKSVWDKAFGDISIVAVYIQRLRKKIENDPAKPKYIETVFGMGYRFNLNPEEEAVTAHEAQHPSQGT